MRGLEKDSARPGKIEREELHLPGPRSCLPLYPTSTHFSTPLGHFATFLSRGRVFALGVWLENGLVVRDMSFYPRLWGGTVLHRKGERGCGLGGWLPALRCGLGGDPDSEGVFWSKSGPRGETWTTLALGNGVLWLSSPPRGGVFSHSDPLESPPPPRRRPRDQAADQPPRSPLGANRQAPSPRIEAPLPHQKANT